MGHISAVWHLGDRNVRTHISRTSLATQQVLGDTEPHETPSHSTPSLPQKVTSDLGFLVLVSSGKEKKNPFSLMSPTVCQSGHKPLLFFSSLLACVWREGREFCRGQEVSLLCHKNVTTPVPASAFPEGKVRKGHERTETSKNKVHFKLKASLSLSLSLVRYKAKNV